MINDKEFYVAPATDVVEVKAQGIICQSSLMQDYPVQPGQHWAPEMDSFPGLL